MAMIAGTAYCISSFPILSVPSAVGVFCPAILYLFTFFAGAKVLISKDRTKDSRALFKCAGQKTAEACNKNSTQAEKSPQPST